MPFRNLGIRSITNEIVTGAAAEQTFNLSLDAAPPAPTIAVPAQHRLVITDVTVGGFPVSTWRLQQTNNGATFFDIGLFDNPGETNSKGSTEYSPDTAWTVVGGTNVAIRMRVQTPDGADEVLCTIRAQEQSTD